MFRRIKADKDTIITNKVINGVRVTDSNAGLAGTLDLFKLYDESSLSGVTSSIVEVSRILIHFDLDPLRELTGSILDFSDASFKANLKMNDVFGGQTIPSNFSLVVFPLSQSFDEGIGRDIIEFRDLDVANFLTASSDSSWFAEGANESGTLGAANLDIVDYGNLGNGLERLSVEQVFSSGEENLSVDVTKLISATLAGQIPDCGFRISFSGTQETDEKTRFVKRFTSRHANNPALRPRIEVFFDDSINDDHRNFFFDLTGTLFLNNFHYGAPANIISNGQQITGSDCIVLRVVSGSGSTFFEKIVTGSQYQIGGNYQTGIYFANFAIDTNETGSIRTEIDLAGSASFDEVWENFDGLPFFSGSFVIKSVPRTAFNFVAPNFEVVVRNNIGLYKSTEKVRFHVYVQNPLERVRASKLPLERKSLLFTNMYYQIRDTNSGKIVIPFEEVNNGTKLSVHDGGMYFDLFMDDLEIGRVYSIELKFTDMGSTIYFGQNEVGSSFRVE